ncbi:hypothetical protein ES707_03205 [subsurface metagenome]
MAQIEVTIDSVRLSLMSGEWVVGLKEKGTEQYLPIYMGPSQANIVKRELIGARFPEPEDYGCFSAGTDVTNFVLESVTVNRFEDDTFYTKLLLSQNEESFEIDCPVAGALALAVRRKAPIFAEEAVLDKAGVAVPA